jgi:hypothetical protein
MALVRFQTRAVCFAASHCIAWVGKKSWDRVVFAQGADLDAIGSQLRFFTFP